MSSARRDRPSPSCARCYRMKKKCDKKVPSCSRCTLAQAQCHAIYRSDKTVIPRSVVSYLESRLAQVGHDPAPIGQHQPDDDYIQSENGQRVLLQAASASFGFMRTARVLQNDSGIHYHARLFYSSERPPLKIPVNGIYIEEPPRMASQGKVFRHHQLTARAIPSWVAAKLFDNYRRNVLPMYPCFSDSDLSVHFKNFYSDSRNGESQESDISCFIVSMVLAISSLSSKANEFRRVVSLSEALQRDALSHASFLAYTSIRSLQCFALMIQMALCLPYSANLWYMSGEVMRMAIALGLHQETHQPSSEARFRQQLFWAIYRMERAIVVATGCPLAISDEYITTEVPSSEGSNNVGISCSAAGHFFQHVRLSQLQSEIHGVQFFDQSLPGNASDYTDWIQTTERSVQAWLEWFVIEGAAPDSAARAADRCLLLLYRPCSRNIIPDESYMRAACSVAVRTIQRTCTAVQTGGLISTYEDVFDAFQSSILLLYAIGSADTLEPGSALQGQAHQALELLNPLFTGIAARWPAVVDAAQYIEELKQVVLRDTNARKGPGHSATDTNLLAELDFMVTQRRIHSVYHQNVEITRPKEGVSTQSSPEFFEPLSDELLQELIGTDFDLLNETLFTSSDLPEIQPVDHWVDGHATGHEMLTTNLDKQTLDQLDTLMRSVPACGHCRTSHVKCDQDFPACGACTRFSRPCVYYDPVLQIDVQRSYVFDLYKRAQSFANNANRRPTTHRAMISGREPSHNVFLPSNSSTSSQENSGRSEIVALDNCYFGPGSHLSYVKRALSTNPDVWPSLDFLGLWDHPAKVNTRPDNLIPHHPSNPASSTMFRLFANTIHVFYPTLKECQLKDLLLGSYTEGFSPLSLDQDLFYLVIAVASLTVKDRDTGLPFTAHAYFYKATRHSERSRTYWLSVDPLSLLQQQLLICIYILFSPESGDLWRNLGVAIRLYFDLSHRPSEDEIDKTLLAMLFRTLYSLESQASIAFGRPSLLIIGDKLRTDMMQSVSGTMMERIGSYFYRISVLKMQVHSRLLSNSTSKQPSTVEEGLQQSLEMELEAWLFDWTSEVKSTLENSHQYGPQLSSSLNAWASLHYNHVSLLINQVYRTGSHNTQQCCDKLFRAFNILIKHQRRSPLLRLVESDEPFVPIYLVNWTIAHVVFSAGLELLVHVNPRNSNTRDASKITRQCVTTLALLESDACMLSTGFSEILEGLWDNLEAKLDGNV